MQYLGKAKILPPRTKCLSSPLPLPPSLLPFLLPSLPPFLPSFLCINRSTIYLLQELWWNLTHNTVLDRKYSCIAERGSGGVVRWGLIFSNTQNGQDCSGQRIMQTSFAGNELQNTFICYYAETLIKSQLLRSYSISGGITVFRTPLLMQTTSQSKRMRAPFPDANDLILSYLAVYI